MEYRVAVRRVLGCAVVLLLAFTACNGGDDDTASPTTTAPSTTTTGPADPYAIPDTIDVAYVQRVIDKLDQVDGEATRIIVREGELVPAAADYLKAVYRGPELDAQLQLWLDDIGDGLDSYRRPPGDVTSAVERILHAAANCIAVATVRDFSATTANAMPPRRTVLTLEPHASNQDPLRLNTTPWMVTKAVVDDEDNAHGCSGE